MKPVSQSRLHSAYIERFLEEHKISLRQVEEGQPVWPTATGKVPVSIEDIERLVSIDDPVAWAWLNFVERKALRDDEDGKVIIPAGSPWALFDVQAAMARDTGNMIYECGAEVGKSRDVVLGCLWKTDTKEQGWSGLIAADSDITLQEIWTEIEFQLEENPAIGGGLVSTRVKPYREKTFVNGNSFQLRLCGHDGKQFRGAHADDVWADEVTKWKYWQQFNELWRAGRPGCEFRLYSTPDGDYSSPFYQMCVRSTPRDGSRGGSVETKPSAPLSDEIPKSGKRTITKMQLPYPLWSESRAAKYREQFGGEQSIGWITNVLGGWGTPSYSVFPMPTLKPCLKYLPHYRMVTAVIDREKRAVIFSAARLSSKLDTEEGGVREDILAREVIPMVSGAELGKMIAAFFPEDWLRDFTDPVLVCGGDLGSSQDPTELIFQRVVGSKWIDVFRLHLANADWPEQAAVVAALDHASGHRVKYGFDSGSAGAALVQVLTQMEEFWVCPMGCSAPVYFAERLSAFGFGDYSDEIDIRTGEPIPNPDKRDKNGNAMPRRLNNKEFSTRMLERKAQARDLEIAWDAGAGNPNLSGPQLLVNHTWISMNNKSERQFKKTDDHHVDARRQAALTIVAGLRDVFIEPSRETVASAGPRRLADEMSFNSPGIGYEFGGSSRAIGGLDW